MSHEAHHDTHHHTADKPTTSFRSSVWFVIILVGLFVAAVNFVNVMGHDEEGEGHETHKVEKISSHEASSTHQAGAAAEKATENNTENTQAQEATHPAEETNPAEEAQAEHH